jgi:hypothetical protein
MMRRFQRGQSTIEFAIAFGAVIMPLTVMVLFTAQMLWLWHSMVEFTRQGAHYAATHCWNAGGSNVSGWMSQHVPPSMERDQFAQGSANIEVTYFKRNEETGALEEFICDGAECSTDCIPDAVTVRVTGYSYGRSMAYLGVPPVPLPDFRTSLPMESAGCAPGQNGETTQCVP